jgi:hypothetical protein
MACTRSAGDEKSLKVRKKMEENAGSTTEHGRGDLLHQSPKSCADELALRIVQNISR